MKWLVVAWIAIAGCLGLRFHKVDINSLKPALSAIGGPPGPGCGTGTTLTWARSTSAKDLPFSPDVTVKRIESDLLASGYERLPGAQNASFRRIFPNGGRIAIIVRPRPEGKSILYCAIGAPKATWFGLRIPAP